MNPTLVTPHREIADGDRSIASDESARKFHQTSRFGDLSIAEDSILRFPAGLIGLGGDHYALLCTDPSSPFLWLQSLDDPGLALPVTNPHQFFTDFTVELDDEDAEQIGVGETDVVDVLVTVTASPEAVTANLKAPILINAGVAHQVINRAPGAQVKSPLLRAAQR